MWQGYYHTWLQKATSSKDHRYYQNVSAYKLSKELEWAGSYLVVNYGCLSQKSLPTMQAFTLPKNKAMSSTILPQAQAIQKYAVNLLDFPLIKVGAKIHKVPILPVFTSFSGWVKSYLWLFSLPHLVPFSSCSSSSLLCRCWISRHNLLLSKKSVGVLLAVQTSHTFCWISC